jgi:hypothetical protein
VNYAKTSQVIAIPAYHDAYRLDGPDGATAQVCAHKAARSWGYVTNVTPPRGGSGQGAFTPASEKRHRESIRASIDAAHDRRVEKAHLDAGWGEDWLPNPVPLERTPEYAQWTGAAHDGVKFDSLCPPAVNPAGDD